ncbi:nuclear envelope integral membrane protein 2 [Chanos chanos]|uniref:Nuclear envelope integral membrane protein 2 n=1 Tax=Chanos chanos TaxID=29144 RepID=A0A6J2WGS2_CHACN|nr:nuclear envelope integral membrane protein 2 [Chanos chanos]
MIILPILGFVFLFTPHAEGNKGYSYADCTYVKGEHDSTHYGSRCFCFSTVIKWKDIWSTFQVRVTGDEDVVVVYPMETTNCHNPDNLFTLTKCLVEHYWPATIQKEKTLEIPLVEEDVCFMVKCPKSKCEYTLEVSAKRLNRIRFALFLSGLLLFFFAGVICRSRLFFYTSGISLGILSILFVLLFLLKNFIPKRGIFLMLFGASSSLSYLGIQKVLTEWDEVMTLHWRELLGYVLAAGFVSFAVCYKHGPIRSERTLTLMTCCMQAGAMVLLFYGITYSPAAYTSLGLLLACNVLPLLWAFLQWTRRQIVWMLRSFLALFHRRSPKVRLLTEEEYREQGEIHTKASLEELREYCSKPGFPAWDTVLKLSKPQRFAKFLGGGSHVTRAETQAHEARYGLGGEYYEDVLFNSHAGCVPRQGGGDDVGENKVDLYAQAPPTPNPIRSDADVPGPQLYDLAVCPYPPAGYSPIPEPPPIEDLELF